MPLLKFRNAQCQVSEINKFASNYQFNNILDRGERSSLRGPRPDEDRLVRLVDVALQLREVSARAARGLQLGGDVQRGMAGEAAPTPLRLRPPRPLLVRSAKVAEPIDHMTRCSVHYG